MPVVGPYHHVHLLSPDPDAAAEWYVMFLGAETVDKGELRGFYNVRLKIGDANLYIRAAAEGEAVAESDGTRRHGIDHFCFVVEGIDRMLRQIEDKGGRITVPLFTLPNGNRGAYVEGPHRETIELLELKKG